METSHTASLIAVESLSASTRLFRFETGGEHLPFIAGQFYRFTFTDATGPFERSYSFSQFDPKLPMSQFELVISAVAGGRATDLLFNAALGLTVQLKGPFGRLILPADDKRCLVLVATSVEVAPFLPMFKALRRVNISDLIRCIFCLVSETQRKCFFKKPYCGFARMRLGSN